MSVLRVGASWCTPWPTANQALLLQAIFGLEGTALANYSAWRDGIDLDSAIDMATYRLLPLLDARLRALGYGDAAGRRFTGIYRRSWYANTLLFERVEAQVRALQTAGIPVMLLKGVPLALGYHADQALRPMSDVDILVRREHVAPAIALLSSATGWTAPLRHEADFNRHYKHSLAFRSDHGEIDLHWHFLRELRGEAAAAWVWQNARPFDFRGIAALQPSPGALLLGVIVHGMRGNPAPPIRWIADAIAILRHDPAAIDWDDVVGFARRQRLTHRLGLGLAYLRRTFEVPFPPEAVRAFAPMRVGIIERIENSIYLASPATRPPTLLRRLRDLLVNYVLVLDTRSGLGLLARLLTGGRHFLRYRRDVRAFYRAQR